MRDNNTLLNNRKIGSSISEQILCILNNIYPNTRYDRLYAKAENVCIVLKLKHFLKLQGHIIIKRIEIL